MSKKKYPRSAELINQLVQMVCAVKKMSMEATMNYMAEQVHLSPHTIYKWRQGKGSPNADSLEILAHIGRNEAQLDRSWGRSLLQAGRYPDVDKLLNQLWPAETIGEIPNNLPRPDHTHFVGRQAEIDRLLQLLSPNHAAPLINIDGIGGVGKTALALEVAHRCLQASTGEDPMSQAPTFEAIIFASAKQAFLTEYGIVPRHQAGRTLRDIYHEIAEVLDQPRITQTTPEEQKRLVPHALAAQRTLLIVDNLETMVEQDEIIGFLYDLPPSVKVLITTRKREGFAPIRLHQLPLDEGLTLLKHQAQEKQVALTSEQMNDLYNATGGVPAAIIYAVGQIASGYSVARILSRLRDHTGDVARFCFAHTMTLLRGQPAHHLFMAMALFPKRPLREAVIEVAGLTTDPIAAEDGLAQLQRFSLANAQEGRFQMLPLTREYGLAELAAHPKFEAEARERWVNYYHGFVEKYGGPDWAEWHITYDHLETEWRNLTTVLEWCKSQNRYDDLKKFWIIKDKKLKKFTHIYGYWDDRIYWLEYLHIEAELRGDWRIVVEVCRALAFTSLLIGEAALIEKAKKLLEKALDLHSHVGPVEHSYLAETYAEFYMLREKDYEYAEMWLQKAKESIKPELYSEEKWPRRTLQLRYQRGILAYEKGQYQKAKQIFEQVVELSQAISWQRAMIFAQNYLADIAIAEDNLAEAESLLKSGLTVVERNKDRRRTAFYQYSYARLCQKQGELTAARTWAEKALDNFSRLGMKPEIESLRQLLAELSAESA